MVATPPGKAEPLLSRFPGPLSGERRNTAPRCSKLGAGVARAWVLLHLRDHPAGLGGEVHVGGVEPEGLDRLHVVLDPGHTACPETALSPL